MEIRDLRALLAVVRTGSFTAAAAELGYTQSAVSQQLAALERELGHRLLTRRPVRPTPAGERLAEHAARILLRLEVARSELGQLAGDSQELRLVACPLAAPDVLSLALRDLRAAGHSRRTVVETMDASEAIAAVAEGRADAALVDGIAGPSEPLQLADAGLLSSTALSEQPCVVALPVGHPLARRGSLDLDTLADAPWVLTPQSISEAEERPILGAIAGADRVQYAGSDLTTVLSLVAAGLGLALLPAGLPLRSDAVRLVPVGKPSIVHRTEILTLRATTDLQRIVVDALRARAPSWGRVADWRGGDDP